jgi:hypothetical protein
LRFPDPGDTKKAVELPANGAPATFEIAGEHASTNKGDAKIQARLNTDTGPLVTEKNVTVFSFDQAEILVKPAGNYKFDVDGVTFTVPSPGHAVSLTAKARLKPAGLDCAAPQIANLVIGIMQENSDHLITIYWDTPVIAWDPGFLADPNYPSGWSAPAVASVVRVTRAYPSTTPMPVNDALGPGAPGIYDTLAMKRPLGCAGGGDATTHDTPYHHAPPTVSWKFPGTGVVTWTRRVNTTRVESFRTFCVVYDKGTQICALRQRTWTLNLDSSGPPADQHAVVSEHDAAAGEAPAVANNMPGSTANTVINDEIFNFVGPLNVTFKKP